MTAIGFLLVAAAFVIALFDDHITLPDWLAALCGAMLLVGGALMVAGVGVWLWREMP